MPSGNPYDHPNNAWSFFLKDAGNHHPRFYDFQIILVEVNDKKLTYFIDEKDGVKEYYKEGTLKSVQEKLSPEKFVRINLNYIINVMKVIDHFTLKDAHYVKLSNFRELRCSDAGWKLLLPHLL